MKLEQFTEQSLAQGYAEVLVREWEPLVQNTTHTHPFASRVRVVRGEFWLTVGEQIRHFQAGEEFTLDKAVEHSERYGSEGTTFWVARRS